MTMQALEAAYTKIQASGLRLTDARKEILETIAKHRAPITIQDIASCTDVDQATVYRNITTLTEVGVLEEINTAAHPTRYALGHGHHHDHLACTNCGLVVHIACTLPTAPLPQHPQFAHIDHHEVTYYGICHACCSAA
jgi:Fe2+ or Zn2+ uptake regulation protein